MRAPTDLTDLMPDCFGHLDRLADEKLAKTVKRIVWIFTAAIAIVMAASAWTFYQQFN